MPSREDLKIRNANSLSNQRATRARLSAEREIRDARNEELQNAGSVSERREIKDRFESIGANVGKSSSGGNASGSIYDVSTESPDPKNEQGYGDRIGDDSIDRVEASGSATIALDGYWFYYADGSTEFINASEFAGTADNYSIQFAVASSAVTQGSSTENDSATSLWDDTGTSQTKLYIPLRRNGGQVSIGGAYMETIICVSGEPAVIFKTIG